ncbi:MAG: sugar ABC transporter permease, partial [Chloroflexi bacterium]|nr:sugar ABC transporter permease [Chloroflexota bacterium]
LVFGIFELYPLARTFLLSLFAWDGFTDPRFIGTRNFEEAFASPHFWQAAVHSLVYALGTSVTKMLLGLAIALLLDRALRGRAIYRSVIFSPALMSFVAVGLLWTLMFNPSLGPVTSLLAPVGLVDPQLGLLGDPDRALASIILVDSWKWVGYHAVLFLAGLSLVSRTLVEAALIDGANNWQRFRYVTLPAIRQVLVINVVIALAGAMNSFDLVYIMTKGGPYRSTEIMLTFMYSTAFTQNRFGYAAAIACLLFAMVGLMTLAVLRIGRSEPDAG